MFNKQVQGEIKWLNVWHNDSMSGCVARLYSDLDIAERHIKTTGLKYIIKAQEVEIEKQ